MPQKRKKKPIPRVDKWEAPCLDCDALVFHTATRSRCDTCEEHHTRACDRSCPIRCTICRKHHFGRRGSLDPDRQGCSGPTGTGFP